MRYNRRASLTTLRHPHTPLVHAVVFLLLALNPAVSGANVDNLCTASHAPAAAILPPGSLHPDASDVNRRIRHADGIRGRRKVGPRAGEQSDIGMTNIVGGQQALGSFQLASTPLNILLATIGQQKDLSNTGDFPILYLDQDLHNSTATPYSTTSQSEPHSFPPYQIEDTHSTGASQTSQSQPSLPPLPTSSHQLTTPPTPPTTTSTSPNTHTPIFNSLAKRATGCGTHYTSCEAIGYPQVCCSTTAQCSIDYGGNAACCPIGAVCTGYATSTTYASGVGAATTTTTANTAKTTTTTAEQTTQEGTTTTGGAFVGLTTGAVTGSSGDQTSAGFIQAGTTTVAVISGSGASRTREVPGLFRMLSAVGVLFGRLTGI